MSCLGPDPASSLARNVLGASTTDHREESAINLLLPEERVTFGLGLSYWSSRGSPDPGSRDWVALRLAHPLVLVQEIRLRPFQAWFQPGGPVYAPVGVRFRIGGPMLFHPGSWQLGEAVLPQVPGVVAMEGAGHGAGAPWPGGVAAGGLGPDGDGGAAGVAMPGGGGILANAGTPTGGGTPAGPATAVPSLDAGRAAAAAPERGGWDPATLTWVSAVFPVQPGVAEVQAFRLPRPVLCVGGCVTVELLGKTQRQEEDGLLYGAAPGVGVHFRWGVGGGGRKGGWDSSGGGQSARRPCDRAHPWRPCGGRAGLATVWRHAGGNALSRSHIPALRKLPPPIPHYTPAQCACRTCTWWGARSTASPWTRGGERAAWRWRRWRSTP